jgi:hypothetical protein
MENKTISTAATNQLMQLMLCTKIITIYSDNHIKLKEQSVDKMHYSFNVQEGGT